MLGESEVIMNKTVTLLKETMIIKNLSPEQAAIYLGCSGRQIRRWIEGKAETTPVYLRAIEAGIKKIDREIPGDTSDGLVSWTAVEISKEEKAIHEKLNVFFSKLIEKAGPGGRSALITLADEHFSGFDEIVHLAAKLKVKLPEI